MAARIVWQAQSRDDIVTANIIEQLIKTAAAKQIMMKYKFSRGAYGDTHIDEFLSHLQTLYDLSLPIIPLSRKNDTSETAFNGKTKRGDRIDPALKLYKKLLDGLKASGVWSISKHYKIKDDVRGIKSVRGT